jgi:hypothetical protein
VDDAIPPDRHALRKTPADFSRHASTDNGFHHGSLKEFVNTA